MGWNLSVILIKAAGAVPPGAVLAALGVNGEAQAPEVFDNALNPGADDLYIGSYRGNLVLCGYGLAEQLIELPESALATRIARLFPHTEMGAFALMSTINYYGYALYQNGKRIRAKMGDADNGLVLDNGAALPEEAALLGCSERLPGGERVYRLRSGEEPCSEAQVGEEFVFALWQRFTGTRLDEDDDLLDEELAAFRISSAQWHLDLIFSGAWRGTYTFGEGYQPSVAGRSEEFELDMELIHGLLQGSCRDLNKPGDPPAVVTGFCTEVFIGFRKEYPAAYFIGTDGETRKNTSLSPTRVLYSGQYDPGADVFKGIWRIEGKSFWGSWELRRK